MDNKVVNVKKSKFGKCKLTFKKINFGTNVYVYCDKDPGRYIRVWYYPPVKGWACEIHNRDNGTCKSYGVDIFGVFGHYRTNKEAWDFISAKYW